MKVLRLMTHDISFKRNSNKYISYTAENELQPEAGFLLFGHYSNEYWNKSDRISLNDFTSLLFFEREIKDLK